MRRILGVLAMVSMAATAQAKNKHAGMEVQTPNGTLHVGMSIPDDDDDDRRGREHEHEHEGHYSAPPGGRWVEQTQDHRLVVRPDGHGRTLLQVVAPEEATLHVWDDGREIFSDEIPTVVETEPHRLYQVQVVFADGSSWTTAMKTKRGMDTKLAVFAPYAPPVAQAPQPPAAPPVQVIPTTTTPPPPAGPQPMDPSRFGALAQAIENESFPQNKLSVLKTAAPHAYFTCEEVGALVDLYSFPKDKVEAVRLVRSHVVDPENAFMLGAHFDFPNDKDEVQRMFR